MDLCARGPISKPLRPKAGGEHPISRIFVTVSRPAPRALAVQRPGSAAHPPPDIAADEAPHPSPSVLPPNTPPPALALLRWHPATPSAAPAPQAPRHPMLLGKHKLLARATLTPRDRPSRALLSLAHPVIVLAPADAGTEEGQAGTAGPTAARARGEGEGARAARGAPSRASSRALRACRRPPAARPSSPAPPALLPAAVGGCWPRDAALQLQCGPHCVRRGSPLRRRRESERAPPAARPS